MASKLTFIKHNLFLMHPDLFKNKQSRKNVQFEDEICLITNEIEDDSLFETEELEDEFPL
jgi:hypothetical protein